MKIIKIITLLIITCIVLQSCKNRNENKQVYNKKESNQTTPDMNGLTTEHIKNSFKKEHNAGTYSLIIESNNEEVSTIKIYSRGLPNEYNETFEIEGQIKESHMIDLNQDGFNEYIIEIKPTDDSGNIHLKGFISNRDKSLSEIVIVEPDELRDVNSDRVNVNSNELIREYDSNGELKTYTYILTKGEAAYLLSAKKR